MYSLNNYVWELVHGTCIFYWCENLTNQPVRWYFAQLIHEAAFINAPLIRNSVRNIQTSPN